MKRHTTEPQRYGHHERASIACRIARTVKRKLKPARLAFVAWQAQRSDEYYGALVDLNNTILDLLKKEARHRVKLSADRMAIEREVA